MISPSCFFCSQHLVTKGQMGCIPASRPLHGGGARQMHGGTAAEPLGVPHIHAHARHGAGHPCAAQTQSWSRTPEHKVRLGDKEQP